MNPEIDPAPPLHYHKIDAPNPHLTIFWFHGLGANCYDFANLPQALQLNFPARFIFPQAPIIPVTINNRAKMPAWYDILQINFDRQVDAAAIHKIIQQIQSLIQLELDNGMPPEKIMLGGFSQGGAVAMEIALSQINHPYPKNYFAVASFSAYLPQAQTLTKKNLPDALKKIPFFLTHGNQDPIVPFSLGQKHKELLEKKGCQITWMETQTDHSITQPQFDALAKWIHKIKSAS